MKNKCDKQNYKGYNTSESDLISSPNILNFFCKDSQHEIEKEHMFFFSIKMHESNKTRLGQENLSHRMRVAEH